ncbi:MAG: hypothetical protein VCD66_18270 [Alphaproteobacteria bacterium]|jgi:hypothetical protein
MASIFQPQYWLLWGALLAIALFFPIRKIIWVMSVRRARRKGGSAGEDEQQRLFRRAGVTAALLSFIFAITYANYLFGPGR